MILFTLEGVKAAANYLHSFGFHERIGAIDSRLDAYVLVAKESAALRYDALLHHVFYNRICIV